MTPHLIKLADSLDKLGYTEKANRIDSLIKKSSHRSSLVLVMEDGEGNGQTQEHLCENPGDLERIVHSTLERLRDMGYSYEVTDQDDASPFISATIRATKDEKSATFYLKSSHPLTAYLPAINLDLD